MMTAQSMSIYKENMEEKIKCCRDCVRLYWALEILQKDKPEDFIDSDRQRRSLSRIQGKLETCPNKCLMYLGADNCTINDDGTVNINNSGKKY